jgi:hypothetical protein
VEAKIRRAQDLIQFDDATRLDSIRTRMNVAGSSLMRGNRF